MTKKKVSLMTWMAIERDPNLFDNVLRAAQELYDVEHVYYLYTSGKKTKTNILEQNLMFMRRKYSSLLEAIPVDINNPSSLEELCEKVQDVLEPRLETMGDIIISTTAGTPAMYASWILLFKSGFFPPGTELFSAQRELKRGKELFENKKIEIEPTQELQRINVKVNTFYSWIKAKEKENQAKFDSSEQTYKFETPKSPKAQEVYENILRFAQVPGAPLLIYGERGVGKSTAVNEWIRYLKSGFKDFKRVRKKLVPLVTINCSSLDPNLAESQIFGYVDGAYTNARKGGMEGLIEKARDGILFLDEVQDLKKDVQRKLLRVLNEHCYTKYGDTSNEEIPIYFDLVCATNKTERELKQRLDLDFYDRICVYKVIFPPLRERREDIPELWRNTWEKICASTGRPELIGDGKISKELNNYFLSSNLYGNIRSLRKIAFLKIAWSEKNDKEILDMVADDEEMNAGTDVLSQDSFFSKYESLSWKDADAQFRKDLAQWSECKYGSFSKVEDALGWPKRNLQNALREKSD